MTYESEQSPTKEVDPLRQLIHDAISYIDTEISPLRAKATDYYFGRPFGNESDGRSKVVITVVRDVVQNTIPSIMRLIFGPEHVVEYRPKTPQAVPKAREATDYVRYIFENESNGFMRTMDVLLDGCIRKLGIYKWLWEDGKVTSNSLSSLTGEQVEMLAAEPGVEITSIRQSELDPTGQMFDVEVKRTGEGRIVIESVPPEEFYWNRSARSLDKFSLVGHRTRKTRSELIEMGVDAKIIDEYGAGSPHLQDNEEAIARDLLQNPLAGAEEPGEKSQQGFLYCENFVYLDRDGDGISELRKICTIGPTYHIVADDATDTVPFATFCPYPEPHTINGQSQADLTMDLQLLKSTLIRGTLDSLSASIFPRTWYKEADANVGDVMNTDIGAPIRTKSGPNAVGVFAHPFVGKEALAVLAYTDEIQEGRVGRASGADGLHMDSMQSSTKAAVAAAVVDRQMRTEMLARIFGETLKTLFRGMLKMIVEKQPRERMVKLGGQWQNVDPASWDADMDVTVNVMLGSGLMEEKVATAGEIIAKQEQIMGLLGPNNALVDLTLYRNAIDEFLSLRGRKDTERYFKRFGEAELKAMLEAQAQQKPEEQQKSPEQTLAEAQIQIETMKAQNELTIKEAELRMKQQQQMIDQANEERRLQMEHEREMQRMQLEDDRQRDKQAAETTLKRMEIEAKYQAQVTAAEVKAEAQASRETTQAGPSGE